jgi:hypothetical protein
MVSSTRSSDGAKVTLFQLVRSKQFVITGSGDCLGAGDVSSRAGNTSSLMDSGLLIPSVRRQGRLSSRAGR